MPCLIRSKVSKFLFCFAILFFVCSSAKALNFSRLQNPPRLHATPTSFPISKVTRVCKRVLARVTVYWPGEVEKRKGRRVYWTARRQSATGIRLQCNAVAVDPRVIPYGSRIKFPDAVCSAIDTGSSVKSRKAARISGRTLEEKAAVVVDRFFETRREAFAWARQNPPFMSLDILPPERTF